jgi:hypothetical protein
MLNTILLALCIVVALGLVPLLAWLAARLAAYIHAKTQNATLEGILIRLDDAIFGAIREVMMTGVDAAKQAATDGKLPPEIAQRAKLAAVERVKRYLGAEGIALLEKVLGLAGPDASSAYIGTRVEAAVHQVKAETKAGPGPCHLTITAPPPTEEDTAQKSRRAR